MSIWLVVYKGISFEKYYQGNCMFFEFSFFLSFSTR